jgi:hypothetical protein
LLEICEDLPEGQDPSPSLAAFNKSFGTSYRGELLSVGYKATSIGDDTSKILTLWKSPTLVDEIGERASEQTSLLLGEPLGIPEKGLALSRRKLQFLWTNLLRVRGRRLLIKKVHYSFKFFSFHCFKFLNFPFMALLCDFQNLRIFFDLIWRPSSQNTIGTMRRKPLYAKELLADA